MNRPRALACYNLPGQVQLLYMATVPAAAAATATEEEEETAPEVDCGGESLEAKWFSFGEIPDEDDLAFPTVKWALDYAAEVALPCLTTEGGKKQREPRWVTGFVPQQRTKLFFGAPTDGINYVDETSPA